MFVCYSAAFCQLCFYNKDWRDKIRLRSCLCSFWAAFCFAVLTNVLINQAAVYCRVGSGGVGGSVYSLVGQTSFRPKELRFYQINLTIDQFIAVEPGDVLGLYAPDYNPLPWTSVPCADASQRPLVSVQPTFLRRPLVVGRRLSFINKTPSTNSPSVSSCRQYSFSALLGQFQHSARTS